MTWMRVRMVKEGGNFYHHDMRWRPSGGRAEREDQLSQTRLSMPP